MKCKILIPTCNKYIKFIKFVLRSFKMYWPDYNNWEIVILGYNPPDFELDSNVSFYSMGKECPIGEWSTPIKKYLQSIDDEYFIYWNDDGPLSSPVSEEILSFLSSFLYENQDSNVVNCCLHGDIATRPHQVINEYPDFKLIEANQSNKYRLSTSFKIWKKEYFLKYLHDNITPWAYELQHPTNDGYRLFGITNDNNLYCTDHYHIFKGGWRPPHNGYLNKEWHKSVWKKTDMKETDPSGYDLLNELLNQHKAEGYI